MVARLSTRAHNGSMGRVSFSGLVSYFVKRKYCSRIFVKVEVIELMLLHDPC